MQVARDLSFPKTLSGVFRDRGAEVSRHDMADADEVGDGFRVDTALTSGRGADRSRSIPRLSQIGEVIGTGER